MLHDGIITQPPQEQHLARALQESQQHSDPLERQELRSRQDAEAAESALLTVEGSLRRPAGGAGDFLSGMASGAFGIGAADQVAHNQVVDHDEQMALEESCRANTMAGVETEVGASTMAGRAETEVGYCARTR